METGVFKVIDKMSIIFLFVTFKVFKKIMSWVYFMQKCSS